MEEKVRAYGGPKYQVTQQVMSRFAEAIESSKVDIVPKILIGAGTGGAQGSSVLEALLALMLSDRLGGDTVPALGVSAPGQEALRNEIRSGLLASLQSNAGIEVPVEVTTPNG